MPVFEDAGKERFAVKHFQETDNTAGTQIADPMPGNLTASLEENLTAFCHALRVPRNKDVIIRRFRAGGFDAALVCIDGMCATKTMDEHILAPAMELVDRQPASEEDRLSWLLENAVSVVPAQEETQCQKALSAVLDGQTLLLCEGCDTGAILDTREYEKRSVTASQNERVVLGPHEGFIENLRTNITLVRRIVRSPRLVTEFHPLGTGIPTRCAVLYLDGVAEERIVAEVRRRLEGVKADFVPGTGELEQLIEDHPYALMPQMLSTERPDRAASFLLDGQVIVLVDGSPFALCMPVTLFHLLHSPDDTFMRWQYGSFLRVVRMLGVLIHIFLPGIYVAIIDFHPDILSPMMLTSIYESRARVPLPSYLEALLLTLSFYLINEAGTRAPSALGSALGIVSGLILGQAAVSADLVSPLLLIVVAASGLGGFAVPNYSLSIALRIAQLVVLTAGALYGLYGVLVMLVLYLALLCRMTSLGSPLVAPLAPDRPANEDIFVRLPLWYQKVRAFFSAPAVMRRIRGRVRAWEGEKRP